MEFTIPRRTRARRSRAQYIVLFRYPKVHDMPVSVELLMEYGLTKSVAERLAVLWQKKCDEVAALKVQVLTLTNERDEARALGRIA